MDPAVFYGKTRDARQVVVVDLGFLGDTVHLLPSLWELKDAYPQSELHVLTSPVGCELLELAPCVDHRWALEMYPGQRTLRQQWEVLRALRRERFDAAFNFSGADRTVFLTALTGARMRLAHMGGRWHFWNRWLIPYWVPRGSSALPVFERRRQVLAACGVKLGQTRFDLRLPQGALDWAAATIPSGAVHLSINASTSLKEWPLESWVTLGRQMAQGANPMPLVATGSARPREQERLTAFAAALREQKVQVFTGLPLAQMAALLRRCRLHVGADSGVLHLAVAMGLPTVSLFRAYSGMAGWLPRGPNHRSLTVECSCAGKKPAPCLGKPFAECLSRISVQDVLAAANELGSAALP